MAMGKIIVNSDALGNQPIYEAVPVAELAELRNALVAWMELADMWRSRAERAEAELAALRVPCIWKREYGGWITGGCSNRPMVGASGFAFCPYCGHRIEVVP